MKLSSYAAILTVVLFFVFLLQPSAFSFNSANWYYTAFSQTPSENAASCNFSPLYYIYNVKWNFLETLGISIQTFWLLLSIAIAAIGVFLQYKWVKLASGSENIALAAALLSFVLIDSLAPATLPAPRHFTFFVLMPIAYYAFFSLLKENSSKNKVLLAIATAATLATNALFGLFYGLSIAAYYAALLFTRKFEQREFLKTAIPLLMGVAIATPLLASQLSTLSSTTPSFSYSDWEQWGLSVGGLWMLNPAKLFYAKGQSLFLGFLLVLALFFAFKSKRKTEFELFVAANVVAGVVLLFTPLGGIIAKIILPGVFAENFVKFIPFHLAIPLAFALLMQAKTIAKVDKKTLAAGLMVLVLAYPVYSYASVFFNPQPSETDYLGGLSAKEIVAKAGGGVILTDFYTAYLLSTAGGGRAIGPNPGYNVCLSQEQVLQITQSNLLFSADSPQHARDLARVTGVKMVFLNERFWELGLNEKTVSSGYAYPQSFEEAQKTFDSYGWGKEGAFYYPS